MGEINLRRCTPQKREDFFIHESFGKGFIFAIDKELWTSLRASRNRVIAIRSCQELFETLVESVSEFEKFMLVHLLDYEGGYLNDNDTNYVFRKLRVGLNLRILTTLNAARAYVEQVPQLIGSDFQDSHRHKAQFSEYLSSIFDSSFEYRTMDALRNFAQHAKLPLGGFDVNSRNISASGNLVSGKPSRNRTTVEPYFYVSQLLGSEKIRRATKDELKALGVEKLDAKYLIRKYLGDLATCHTKLLDDLSGEFKKAAQELADARKLLAEKKGEAVEIVGIGRRINEQVSEDLYIDGEFYSATIELNRRTQSLQYRTRSFVSSEVTFRKDTYSGDDSDLWRSN
jgi:hypothetical protein